MWTIAFSETPKRKKKRLPRFKNENEERDFWATHDSTDYINWREAKRVRLEASISKKRILK